ncbi:MULTISPECIES: COX15/CtaA family protein [Bacillaceae]|uniref:Heme A synthase n=1 Tax=Alkalicoccobacillus plakortidis TaxID=444060 RepID=A0A9D5DQL9_9BACI|nr:MULTISPECIES: heme A synthase [Bacillaceae]KQL58537.1 heme A synthase [Alkalicoccobacillus plakortidis]
MKKLRIFSIVTTIVVLFVLLQGSIVTKTGSGQGCGTTWPLCFGDVIPYNPTLETIIEYTHRLLSSIAGMLVFILSFWSWKRLSYVKEIRFFALLASAAILLQGLMGAGQVVYGQPPLIMALHFGFSAISLAAVSVITLFTFEKRWNPFKVTVEKAFLRYVIALTIYSYLVIYTGAFVKHMGAATACSGFPLCNGEWILFSEGTIVFAQMFHRLAGMTLALLVLLFAVWAIRMYKKQRSLVIISLISTGLIGIQLASGIGMVLTYNQNLTIGIIHALTISLLFALFTYTIVLSRRG